MASIMTVTGAVFQKKMPMQLPDMNNIKTYCPMQYQSVINKKNRRQKKHFVSNIVSNVSSTSKKADKNEVRAIKDLLQCSMSSAYRW